MMRPLFKGTIAALAITTFGLAIATSPAAALPETDLGEVVAYQVSEDEDFPEPIHAKLISVFGVSYMERVAEARTLGTEMFVDEDGNGYIGCDVEVSGIFDLESSYCEGQITGAREPLQPDLFGREDRYFATLTGLDPFEEVRVFIVSPNGVEYEALPTLNPENPSAPDQSTPELGVVVESTVSLTEKRSAEIRRVPSVTLTFEDARMLGIDRPFPHIPYDDILPRPTYPAVQVTLSSPGGCGPDADPRCLGPPARALTKWIKKGDTIDFGGVSITLEDILRVKNDSPLQTYLGIPSGKWKPGIYVDGTDSYVVGFFENKEIVGEEQIVTLSGEQVSMPAWWYKYNEVNWEDDLLRGFCIHIPVDLSWPAEDRGLDAQGPAERVPCEAPEDSDA